jgi:hypothetical protein
MNKKMRLLGLYFAGVLFLGSFIVTSCSKDDDDGGNNNGKVDPSTIAATNLVAYFPFDAEGETVQKANNTITFNKKVGAASFVTGRRGKAYQGSTSEAYLEYDVTTSNPLNSLDEFTLAAWLKTPVTTSGAAKIFTVNGGDSFMGNLTLMQESQATGDSVDMKMYLYDSESPEWKGQDIRKQATPFLNNKWFHIVALYRKSASTIELYANGKFVASSVRYAGPQPTQGDQPLLGAIKFKNDMTKIHFGAWTQQIAGSPESWMTYYQGLLDEFRIYNKALSEQEIEDLYDAEVSQLE